MLAYQLLDSSVGSSAGLLIRRSLVRAQVEEPNQTQFTLGFFLPPLLLHFSPCAARRKATAHHAPPPPAMARTWR